MVIKVTYNYIVIRITFRAKGVCTDAFYVLETKMLTTFVWLACKNELLCDQWFLYQTLQTFDGTHS